MDGDGCVRVDGGCTAIYRGRRRRTTHVAARMYVQYSTAMSLPPSLCPLYIYIYIYIDIDIDIDIDI